MENLDNSNTSSNDPESMKSRVFIGHLATDRLIRQDLQILFEKYGEIEGKYLKWNIQFNYDVFIIQFVFIKYMYSL